MPGRARLACASCSRASLAPWCRLSAPTSLQVDTGARVARAGALSALVSIMPLFFQNIFSRKAMQEAQRDNTYVKIKLKDPELSITLLQIGEDGRD